MFNTYLCDDIIIDWYLNNIIILQGIFLFYYLLPILLVMCLSRIKLSGCHVIVYYFKENKANTTLHVLACLCQLTSTTTLPFVWLPGASQPNLLVTSAACIFISFVSSTVYTQLIWIFNKNNVWCMFFMKSPFLNHPVYLVRNKGI